MSEMPTNRIQHVGAVARLVGVLGALAAALALTSVTAASPEVTRQWVAMTATGAANPSGTFEWDFTPLQSGALEPDSGTETATFKQRVVKRGGRSVTIVDWTTTSKGERGTLVIRASMEHVQIGNGYEVGVGTWKVLRGTGQYAGLSGRGRVLNAWLHGQDLTERREGFLTPG
jgi:hypothetical protein